MSSFRCEREGVCTRMTSTTHWRRFRKRRATMLRAMKYVFMTLAALFLAVPAFAQGGTAAAGAFALMPIALAHSCRGRPEPRHRLAGYIVSPTSGELVTLTQVPPVLEFERLSKRYPRAFKATVHALEDFTLSIEPGEIFGFLGPNGAGKTTAIHIAMGFMRPTSGSGRILGERFGDASIRSRVGFLAENVALYHRPADKAVCFYGALNGMNG